MLADTINRRSFLKKSSVITSGALLLPRFLSAQHIAQRTGRQLVVIQLSGGNDGLNTIIPFQDDELHRARPTLAPDKSGVLRISDEVGLNAVMKGFNELFDQGDVCILNSVGYPNPNRSHFRSMDIWQSGSGANEYWPSGWLGRYLDNECENPNQLTAVEMSNVLSLAMKGERLKGIPITNIRQFYKSSQQINIPDESHEHEMASFLYKTLGDTKSSAEYLFEKNKVFQSKKNYPQNAFANQLKEVAQMIISGVESPIYYVSLSGFDTHNRQQKRQERLLSIYSDSLKVFVDDLKQNDRWDETLVMTFSEFGRRVKQNGSAGTDHGKANNLFILGGKLKTKGFYNAMPNLTDLDEGDVKHTIDFRQVYSTILTNWLEADASNIMGQRFSRLGFV